MDGVFLCKFRTPKPNILQSEFIENYMSCYGMRDGMSGGLLYGTVVDLAKRKFNDDELDDYIDFITECEGEVSKVRSEKSEANKS